MWLNDFSNIKNKIWGGLILKYEIDKRLVLVLDPVSGEDDLAGDENNLTSLLSPIFELFGSEVEVVIRNSFDQLEYEIAARKFIPAIIFIHLKEKKELTLIVKLKKKFKETKIFVYFFDNEVKDIEFFQGVEIFRIKK